MGKITTFWKTSPFCKIAAFLLIILMSAGVSNAQETTPTATSSSTPEPAQITLTLYRDEDSLTLYVPASTDQVNLRGLAFQVTTATGVQITRSLDQNFSAFLGMPFDNLLTPVCFRIVRGGSRAPVPQNCQGNILLLIQEVAAADVFWYDSSVNQDRLILILKDGTPFGVCASGQVECVINYVLPTPTPTFTPSPIGVATLTPTIQATATEIATQSPNAVTVTITPTPVISGRCLVTKLATINNVIVWSAPSSESNSIGKLGPDEQYEFISNVPAPGFPRGFYWYSINYQNQTGWVFGPYVIRLGDCSSLNPTKEPCLMTVRTNSNIRSGPGTQYDVIGNMTVGEKGVVASIQNQWYSISFENHAGWIRAELGTLEGDCTFSN